MRIVGWIVKHELLLWVGNLRRSIRRGHDSTRRSTNRKEGGSYLVSGPTSDNRRPSPIPRAVLAGLIAGLVAGLLHYHVIKNVFGGKIGVIAEGNIRFGNL